MFSGSPCKAFLRGITTLGITSGLATGAGRRSASSLIVVSIGLMGRRVSVWVCRSNIRVKVLGGLNAPGPSSEVLVRHSSIIQRAHFHSFTVSTNVAGSSASRTLENVTMGGVLLNHLTRGICANTDIGRNMESCHGLMAYNSAFTLVGTSSNNHKLVVKTI